MRQIKEELQQYVCLKAPNGKMFKDWSDVQVAIKDKDKSAQKAIIKMIDIYIGISTNAATLKKYLPATKENVEKLKKKPILEASQKNETTYYELRKLNKSRAILDIIKGSNFTELMNKRMKLRKPNDNYVWEIISYEDSFKNPKILDSTDWYTKDNIKKQYKGPQPLKESLELIQYNRIGKDDYRPKVQKYVVNSINDAKKIFANSHELDKIDKVEVKENGKVVYTMEIIPPSATSKRYSIKWKKETQMEAKFKVGDKVGVTDRDMMTYNHTGEIHSIKGNEYFVKFKDDVAGTTLIPHTANQLKLMKEPKSIKQLVEAANRKCEMRWKVLAFNPDKDNELVEEFKDFDCIDLAAQKKRELLAKNPNYTVELIAESVTKANYSRIIKDLSDTIAKAAKKYPEAKLVKNYQATTGSHGAFLDKGLHFTGKDALSKAIAVSEELQKVMSKYGFKNNIGGTLPYMIGNNFHSTIVTFGLVQQGSLGASVGYNYMKDALKFLESAQKNEDFKNPKTHDELKPGEWYEVEGKLFQIADRQPIDNEVQAFKVFPDYSVGNGVHVLYKSFYKPDKFKFVNKKDKITKIIKEKEAQIAKLKQELDALKRSL